MVEAVGVDRAHFRREDRAAHAGQSRAKAEGQELGSHQVDAHGLGHVFVFSQGFPRAAHARVIEAARDEPREHNPAEDEVIQLPFLVEHAIPLDAEPGEHLGQPLQRWLGDVQHAQRAAHPRLEPVRVGQNADDFAEAQGHDGQVVIPHPQHGDAQNHARAEREEHGQGQGLPKVPAVAQRPGRG